MADAPAPIAPEAPPPPPVAPIPEAPAPEPPAALPEDRIAVVAPDGSAGSVPSAWFFQAGIQKGYKLPAPPAPAGNGLPQPADVADDHERVKVVDAKGQQGTVPTAWYLEHGQAGGYTLASQGGEQIAHQARVAGVLDALATKDPSKVQGLGGPKEEVQTAAGDYKLLAPNGDRVTVSPEHLQTALAGGFKFQSQDFAALVDAHKQLGAGEGLSRKSLEAGAGGFAGTIPGFDWLRDEMAAGSESTFGKAWTIANRQLEQTTQATAHGVGTALGVAGQAVTGGLFGEGALASGAGEALTGALAPAGSSLGRQLATRALAGAVEGAIVSAPQALAQGILSKDPAGAAESLALGMGIGGILGVGSKLVGSALDRGASLLAPRIAEQGLSKLGASTEALERAGGAKEPFFKSLLEAGVHPASGPEEVQAALARLSAGEHMGPTLKALDKVAEPLSTTALAGKIGFADQLDAQALYRNPKGAEAVAQLGENLSKLAPDGKITLENLQRFVRETADSIDWKAKAEDVANNARKQALKDAQGALMAAGDAAAGQGADAKIVTAWGQQRAIAGMAEGMRGQMLADIAAGKLTPSASPVFQAVKGLVEQGARGGAAALGHVIGGPVGGLVGLGAGKAIAAKAGELVEHYASNPANSSKLAGWLRGNAASPAIASYMALDAVHAVAQRVADVPAFFAHLAEKTPAQFLGAHDPIKDALGPMANGLTKAQQYQRLSSITANLVGNPEALAAHVQGTVAPFGSHPELADAAQAQYLAKIQFLHGVLHGPNTAAPQPFQKPTKYTPTTADLKDMEDQLRIAQNPFALLDGLKKGTVTSKQVAIAATLNPEILGKIRAEVHSLAYSGKGADLTYQQRLSASVIMGQAMDKSLASMQALQGTYGGGQGPSAGGAPPGGGGQPKGQGKAPKMNSAKMPAAQSTLAQRLRG